MGERDRELRHSGAGGLDQRGVRCSASSTIEDCVWRWQERFAAEGVEGLLRDKTRPSRILPLGSEVAERVVALTHEDPPGETTHWTADMMAKAVGISASAVRRIWKAHGLQPHRGGGSSSPAIRISSPSCATSSGFTSTRRACRRAVGDEKSQIQALDRTQPGLPMKKGRPAP